MRRLTPKLTHNSPPPIVLILTHGDTDGVCAAAIAKMAYPNARVEFTVSSDLASKLCELSGYDRLVILDLRPGKEQMKEVKQALAEISKTCSIIYIDHHPFAKGVTRKDFAACDAIVHRANASTSELALEFFKPPSSHEFIAVLGAIGDYQDHTQRMKRLIDRYTARKCYPEAVIYLDQVLRVTEGSFRRRIIEELARGKWPHEIPLAKNRASRVLEQQRIIENHIRNKSKRVCKRVLFVGDVPHKASGLAAELLIDLLGAEVGIASRGASPYLYLSARRRWGSNVRLNVLMEKCTSAVGGVGGGHVGASGGKIPSQNLDDFLKLVRLHFGE
jgi:single-stranded-DNA-specific exonuclease